MILLLLLLLLYKAFLWIIIQTDNMVLGCWWRKKGERMFLFKRYTTKPSLRNSGIVFEVNPWGQSIIHIGCHDLLGCVLRAMKGVEEEVVDAVHMVKFQPLHQLFERAAETFAKMSWVCVHKNISHTCHGVKLPWICRPHLLPWYFLKWTRQHVILVGEVVHNLAINNPKNTKDRALTRRNCSVW